MTLDDIKKIGKNSSKENIIVKTDHAFYKPIRQKLAEIESKVVPVDFSKLEFEDSIENYALEDLSPEAVTKIIEIIREDEQTRIEKIQQRVSDNENISLELEERIKDGGWTEEDSTLSLSKLMNDSDIDEIEKIEKEMGAPFDEKL